MFQTMHKDYQIVYSETEGVWVCLDLELRREQLFALRSAIDDYLREDKRLLSEVPAILMEWDGFKDVTVKSLETGSYCWISFEERGRRRRQKVRIDALAHPTKENRAIVERYSDLEKQRSALVNEMQEVRSRLVTMTLADLRAAAVPGGEQ